MAVAAVAVGALATAGQSLVGVVGEPSTTELAAGSLALVGSGDVTQAVSDQRLDQGLDAATSGVMAVPAAATAARAEASQQAGQVSSLSKAQGRAKEAAARAEAARAPKTVMPVQGRLTSSFGPRWGTSHNALDLANKIGTPIVAAAGGTVINSGPASGFGLWVRIRLDDGTIHVYGHINRSFVTVGEKVKAGERIAEVGNRGQSTGPHLHFEVVKSGGTKTDPARWLQDRGVAARD